MVIFIVRGVMWLYALLEECCGYICIISGVLWLYMLY